MGCDGQAFQKSAWINRLDAGSAALHDPPGGDVTLIWSASTSAIACTVAYFLILIRTLCCVSPLMQVTWVVHAATSCRHDMHDNREDLPKEHHDCIVRTACVGMPGWTVNAARCELQHPNIGILKFGTAEYIVLRWRSRICFVS